MLGGAESPALPPLETTPPLRETTPTHRPRLLPALPPMAPPRRFPVSAEPTRRRSVRPPLAPMPSPFTFRAAAAASRRPPVPLPNVLPFSREPGRRLGAGGARGRARGA
ncbi:unnamed protein product [Coccothraustes coccothraustes]